MCSFFAGTGEGGQLVIYRPSNATIVEFWKPRATIRDDPASGGTGR